MRPFLTVYGHVCLDQIMSLARFPEPNTSVDIVEKHRYFGGTGANIATVAASLGVPTALVSYVGSDLPDEFRRNMEEHGVDLSEMVMVDGYETSTVMIVTDSEQNQIAFVYQGPMRDMGDFDLLTARASESSIVHVSTGRPEYYLRLMEMLRSLGKEISFDPAQEIHHIWSAETFRHGIGFADTFFCNANELRTALRYLGMERPEELLSSVGTIINTRGAEGSVAFTADGSIAVPAIPPSCNGGPHRCRGRFPSRILCRPLSRTLPGGMPSIWQRRRLLCAGSEGRSGQGAHLGHGGGAGRTIAHAFVRSLCQHIFGSKILLFNIG